MFLTRLISGILLLIFTFFTIFLGGDVLLLTLFLISLIGLYELYKVMEFEKKPLAFVGYLATLFWYLTIKAELIYPTILTLITSRAFILGAVVLMLGVFVLSYPKYSANQLFSSVFGIIYVPVMISCIYRLRSLPLGNWFVWLIFVAAWGTDTCAYVTGRLFGKHKLAPVLSPKKSIEGSIGGIFGAVLIAVLFGFAMLHFTAASINIPLLALLTGIGSVISQIGDLAASGIKRNFNIKDYGNLIPGHGGILDRYDSIIITAPIIYYLVYFTHYLGEI